MARRYDGNVVLIVNGDDVGVTQIFTDATIDAYKKGAVSSVSIIAPGHDAARAIELLKANAIPVGVHLSLTGDWEPLTDGPSLRGPNGLMWNTTEEVGANVVPVEASKEWAAQIRRILDAGLEVTHLDSHMGCYFATAQLFAAAYELARRYGVPLISQYIPGWVPADQKPLFPVSSYIGIYRLEGGKEETLANRAEAYRRMIGGLGPGIHYVYSHHGWLPPDGAMTGDLDLRVNDYKFWSSAETKAWLDTGGYVLIGAAVLKVEFTAALRATPSE